MKTLEMYVDENSQPQQKAPERKRINISMSGADYEAIRLYCLAKGLTMSSFVTQCAMERVQTYETLIQLQTMSNIIQRMDKDGVDDESLNKLELLVTMMEGGIHG